MLTQNPLDAEYRTLPNKYTPDFLLYLAISQKLLNRSQSSFQHSMLRDARVHTVIFMEIRQGYGFIFCLRARRVYLAKYGIHLR